MLREKKLKNFLIFSCFSLSFYSITSEIFFIVVSFDPLVVDGNLESLIISLRLQTEGGGDPQQKLSPPAHVAGRLSQDQLLLPPRSNPWGPVLPQCGAGRCPPVQSLQLSGHR